MFQQAPKSGRVAGQKALGHRRRVNKQMQAATVVIGLAAVALLYNAVTNVVDKVKGK